MQSTLARCRLDQINREVVRILDLPEVREKFQSVDFNVATSTPEAFDRLLRSDIEAFSRVAKAGGLIAK